MTKNTGTTKKPDKPEETFEEALAAETKAAAQAEADATDIDLMTLTGKPISLLIGGKWYPLGPIDSDDLGELERFYKQQNVEAYYAAMGSAGPVFQIDTIAQIMRPRITDDEIVNAAQRCCWFGRRIVALSLGRGGLSKDEATALAAGLPYQGVIYAVTMALKISGLTGWLASEMEDREKTDPTSNEKKGTEEPTSEQNTLLK